MLTLYYKIWVDCILRARQVPENSKSWPKATMFAMTIAMSSNFIFVMTIIEKSILNKYFYKLDFPVLPSRINNLLSYIFLFILPCLLMNYFFIFYNKRYEKIIKKYKYYNGKLFVTYFIVSMFLPLVVILTGIFFFS